MIGFVSTEKKAIQWLVRLQSPELTASEEVAFARWLGASAENQAAYIRAEKLWYSGTALSHNPQSATSKALALPGWLTYASAVTLVVFVTFAVFFFRQVEPTTLEYHTSVGEQDQHTLTDGSVVNLNTDTQLTVSFSPTYRRAELSKGEAYFDIKKNPTKPFELKTRFGVVRVLGTRFSVRQTADDAIVTVVGGKVGLAPSDQANNTPERSAIISANQQLSMKDAQLNISAQQVNATAQTAWLKQQLVYKDISLADVVADLNRYFDTKIALGDPGLGNKQVIAVIQLENIDKTLAALSVTLGLTVEYSPDHARATLLSPSEN